MRRRVIPAMPVTTPTREFAGFEEPRLFDVQFNGRRDVAGAHRGAGQGVGPATDADDGLGQGLAPGARGAHHRFGERARPDSAADAGDAVFAGLLGQEVDDPQRMAQRDAVVGQRRRDLDRRYDARDAVEPAAFGHGVGMRPDDDGRKARLGAPAARRPDWPHRPG